MPPQSNEQNYLGSLKPRATDLSSSQLHNWSERIKKEAVFSARTTCTAYLDSVKAALRAVASRQVIPQVAERKLQDELTKLGYDPRTGFPADRSNPNIPAATRGSITDLSSSRRIQLILDTNVKRARSMGQVAASEDPLFRMTNPAWRLSRTGARKKPRGDWRERWNAAGASVAWRGASKTQYVALKDSPIWDALGRGVGGFGDALGSPYPPFAFGSGLAWVNVGRREWQRICQAEGIDDGLESLKKQAKAAMEAPPEGSMMPKAASEPPTDRAKVAEALRLLREARARREQKTPAYSTEKPVPLPPYANKPPSSKAKFVAEREISEARRILAARRESIGKMYLVAADRTLAKMNKALKELDADNTPPEAARCVEELKNARNAIVGVDAALKAVDGELAKQAKAIAGMPMPETNDGVADFDAEMYRRYFAAKKLHARVTDAYAKVSEANKRIAAAYRRFREHIENGWGE